MELMKRSSAGSLRPTANCPASQQRPRLPTWLDLLLTIELNAVEMLLTAFEHHNCMFSPIASPVTSAFDRSLSLLHRCTRPASLEELQAHTPLLSKKWRASRAMSVWSLQCQRHPHAPIHASIGRDLHCIRNESRYDWRSVRRASTTNEQSHASACSPCTCEPALRLLRGFVALVGGVCLLEHKLLLNEEGRKDKTMHMSCMVWYCRFLLLLPIQRLFCIHTRHCDPDIHLLPLPIPVVLRRQWISRTSGSTLK